MRSGMLLYKKDTCIMAGHSVQKEMPMGEWLEGRTLAAEIREEVRKEAAQLLEERDEAPCLVAILVGDDRASQVYVRTKERACQKLGLCSEVIHLPAETPPVDLTAKIEELNHKDEVDGILVQLPLPASFDTFETISSLSPEKDVDGIHPFSLGSLLMNERGLRPCTPKGIMALLGTKDISIKGKRVVIIGRSILVGKPLAAMMTNEHGTVTICHSRTQDLPGVASEADILVAAMGRAAFVTLDFVKEGAVVVDVGINSLSDEARVKELFGEDEKREQDLIKKGYTLIGDVHPGVIEKASYLTPVPGGVGPLTVAMLMRNTLDAYKMRRGLS
jgi:methylenetetrahydrofolate dehydrogenase (NADP+)/methenyltetrahydrofolate cyclohydrolase